MSALLKMLVLSTMLLLSSTAFAQKSKFQPCPLLGPFVPAPVINASSKAQQAAFGQFTTILNDYVIAGDGEFGPISPNTTSFGIALFAGSNSVADADAPPYFFEYHHTASQLRAKNVTTTSDSIYALGDLTQLFTVFAMLAEEGDRVLSKSIVEFLPELLDIIGGGAEFDPIAAVDWRDVTLGALAGQMSGIARDSNACRVDRPCHKDSFLEDFATKPPVYLPDTTPIFSNAAFQLLALAMEARCDKPFSSILFDRVLGPLNMTHSGLLHVDQMLFDNRLSEPARKGEPASQGMYSTLRDLSMSGRAMLKSELIPAAQTRRWLKPISDTSNLRNGVGRPWEIYHYGDTAIDPVVDIYTKTGSIGRYSSYFGLAPSYDVGFAILAADTGTEAPDLNAYADVVVGALLELGSLARAQANATLVGTYVAGNTNNQSESKITIDMEGEDAGLKVTSLTVNGTNWLAEIARLSGIDPKNIDYRIYPTDLEKRVEGGSVRAFRAVIQDRSALVDAGTPTCISWQTIDELQRGGLPLDDLLIDFGSSGAAVAVRSPALGVTLVRT